MDKATIEELQDRVNWARTKHPNWKGQGAPWALGVILDEVDELIHAVERESEHRQREEAKDVVATCVRFIQGEYK